ncbi:uncharacterized protein METZ01_LOCUS317791, partial [marine metagenome]
MELFPALSRRLGGGQLERIALKVALLVVSLVVAVATDADAQDVAAGQVTFTRDVAPILQRSCQVCHRPQNMAPMSLRTYEEVRPWARAIKTGVVTRTMPPWHIDKKVGIQRFKADRSLTDEEIATIVKWVDSGAPRGNLDDMPPPVQFQDFGAWTIEPDV